MKRGSPFMPSSGVALAIAASLALIQASPSPTERATAATVTKAPGYLPDAPGAANSKADSPDSTAISTKETTGTPAKSHPRVVKVIHSDSALMQGKTRILEGHVHIREEDTDFYADRILYDEEKKIGEATQDPAIQGGSIGPPMAKDDLNALVADKMTLDFSSKDPAKKVVSAVGHVRFTAKPRPKTNEVKSASASNGAPVSNDSDKSKDAPATTKATPTGGAASTTAGSANAEAAPKSEEDKARKERMEKKVREETTLVCDRIDYYYRIKRAEAWGGLKVVQGKRWITGDKATYYERYDTILVNGDVKGQDEKGRDFEADNLKVDMSGDDDVVEANQFHGAFELEEEEEKSTAPADAAPPAFPGSESSKPKAASKS